MVALYIEYSVKHLNCKIYSVSFTLDVQVTFILLIKKANRLWLTFIIKTLIT